MSLISTIFTPASLLVILNFFSTLEAAPLSLYSYNTEANTSTVDTASYSVYPNTSLNGSSSIYNTLHVNNIITLSASPSTVSSIPVISNNGFSQFYNDSLISSTEYEQITTTYTSTVFGSVYTYITIYETPLYEDNTSGAAYGTSTLSTSASSPNSIAASDSQIENIVTTDIAESTYGNDNAVTSMISSSIIDDGNSIKTDAYSTDSLESSISFIAPTVTSIVEVVVTEYVTEYPITQASTIIETGVATITQLAKGNNRVKKFTDSIVTDIITTTYIQVNTLYVNVADDQGTSSSTASATTYPVTQTLTNYYTTSVAVDDSSATSDSDVYVTITTTYTSTSTDFHVTTTTETVGVTETSTYTSALSTNIESSFEINNVGSKSDIPTTFTTTSTDIGVSNSIATSYTSDALESTDDTTDTTTQLTIITTKAYTTQETTFTINDNTYLKVFTSSIPQQFGSYFNTSSSDVNTVQSFSLSSSTEIVPSLTASTSTAAALSSAIGSPKINQYAYTTTATSGTPTGANSIPTVTSSSAATSTSTLDSTSSITGIPSTSSGWIIDSIQTTVSDGICIVNYEYFDMTDDTDYETDSTESTITSTSILYVTVTQTS